jgi:hypothetical protein
MRKDIAVNTVNELRSILGDATIDGGDDLIQPAQTQMIDEKTQYENLLREQKDANGNRLFSEHDIKNLSKTYY